MRRARHWLPGLALCAACASPPEEWETSYTAPYASYTAGQREQLILARSHMEAAGEHVAGWEDAWRVLAPLARDAPDNIELGVLLQDVELELIARASQVDPELAAIARRPSPEVGLRLLYTERLEASPSVAQLVLAARLESDAIAADNLLGRALELDPACAWAHYGRAHALLRQRRRRDRWSVARGSLQIALEIHPGHLPARRLEAWMLSQEGELNPAAYALGAWLDATRDDPRVSSVERVKAEVDLAALFVLQGRPDDAVVLLRTLEGFHTARDRRLGVLAVAEHESGDTRIALDVARRAEGAADSPLLSMVQQAMLYEYWIGDREAADAQWQAVIEEAAEHPDLAAMLQAMRARVALERAVPKE